MLMSSKKATGFTSIFFSPINPNPNMLPIRTALIPIYVLTMAGQGTEIDTLPWMAIPINLIEAQVSAMC